MLGLYNGGFLTPRQKRPADGSLNETSPEEAPLGLGLSLQCFGETPILGHRWAIGHSEHLGFPEVQSSLPRETMFT